MTRARGSQPARLTGGPRGPALQPVRPHRRRCRVGFHPGDSLTSSIAGGRHAALDGRLGVRPLASARFAEGSPDEVRVLLVAWTPPSAALGAIESRGGRGVRRQTAIECLWRCSSRVPGALTDLRMTLQPRRGRRAEGGIVFSNWEISAGAVQGRPFTSVLVAHHRIQSTTPRIRSRWIPPSLMGARTRWPRAQGRRRCDRRVT
jgi:hypothetical protein